MPFMDEPPGAAVSSALIKPYGTFIRKLRSLTNATANKEPEWHRNGPALTTGYDPHWRA
jgi:hydrogenase small subunit